MTPEEQLQLTNETLYKHSHELAVKNKALSFLSQLYEISTLTLTQKQLAEQVAVALQTEFDFEIVSIYQYVKDADELLPLSVVTSERIKGIASSQFDALEFEKASANQFMASILSKGTMHYSEQLTSVWQQEEIRETCLKIETEKYIRSSLGYPLIIGQEVIGVVIISLNRTYKDLIDYERDSILNFMNVISITLNRVTLYEELGLANKRQENLIHFITHEVKGYLTKSQAVFAAITEGDFKGVPDNLISLAGRALTETKNGVETVTDILEASNLKKGTTQYETTDFDLKTLVTNAAKTFEITTAEKGLEFSTVVDEGTYTFTGDEKKITHHLVRNLIDNAIRYTPTGSIKVHLSKTTTDYLFTVQDTGVGIDAEDIGRLFVEGGRAKDSIKVNVDSTGYGLFIAKMIVEAYKGSIWVESKGRGQGSTFFVTLPFQK